MWNQQGWIQKSLSLSLYATPNPRRTLDYASSPILFFVVNFCITMLEIVRR
uniref:Uncharacterized protein n=1 Tax=Rhizophora mucronata TaxID=61149 RepID=A0A2P2QI43_RHIMU